MEGRKGGRAVGKDGRKERERERAGGKDGWMDGRKGEEQEDRMKGRK